MSNEAPGREETLKLWSRVKTIARTQPDRYGVLDSEYRLSNAHVERVIDFFLCSVRARNEQKVDYWMAHGKLTGELMARLAKKTGRNVTLYRQVGILHDADYFMHPHYGGEDGLVHPAPLCEKLLSDSVHPVVVLAILEHAGYTGCGEKFSSPLSAAISTCDDLATFMSALGSPSFTQAHGYTVSTKQLSVEARELIKELKNVPIFPADFHCPHRVLGDIDLYVNNSLPKALNDNTGEFRV